MTIKLLHHTPLWVCSTAIRKCWASEGKSDTRFYYDDYDYYNDEPIFDEVKFGQHNYVDIGEKDKELIHRIGNKNKHSSTLEHLVYSFDVDGISRACLQELARHRMCSYSVKSTRYTLKELKGYSGTYDEFLVRTENPHIDYSNTQRLKDIQTLMTTTGDGNDNIKYLLPEAYKTSLVMTINARSLQNFLTLRTSPSALWEIRELAQNLFDNLPEEHKYLFEEYLYEAET